MLFSNISKNDFMLFVCCQEKKMNRIFNNYTTADYCPTTTKTRIKNEPQH